MNTKGMQQIGRGAFSTVYKRGRNKVLIKSTDKVKECMSLGWFPSSKLFPKLSLVGESSCGEFSFYEEKYYPKVNSLKKTLSDFEWEFYKVLRSLDHFYYYLPTRYLRLHKAFSCIPGKFHRKRSLLLDALNALSNYGDDICFEISPRNVATQGDKLVLLDCFFFASDLNKRR
jgi:hypothetical protein